MIKSALPELILTLSRDEKTGGSYESVCFGGGSYKDPQSEPNGYFLCKDVYGDILDLIEYVQSHSVIDPETTRLADDIYKQMVVDR